MNIEKLSDRELINLCKEYGAKALNWRRRFIALLPEVAKRGLYRQKNCHSIYEFAAKFGGVSNRMVDEVIRTAAKVEDKPLLREQIAEEGLVKVKAVLPLIETEKEKDLVDMVKSMPRRPLEAAVQNIKSQQQAATPGCKMSFEVDEETELELRKFKQELEKQRKEPVSFNETLKELLKQVREEPVVPRPNTKTLTKAKKRQLLAKTNGKCSRCKHPASQFHHPDRQSLKPGHENVVPLCKTCHQLAHSGRVINENNHPSTWRIQAKILESPKVRIDRKVQRNWKLMMRN